MINTLEKYSVTITLAIVKYPALPLLQAISSSNPLHVPEPGTLIVSSIYHNCHLNSESSIRAFQKHNETELNSIVEKQSSVKLIRTCSFEKEA